MVSFHLELQVCTTLRNTVLLLLLLLFAFVLVSALLVLWKDLVITGVLNAHMDMKASTVKGRINEKGRNRKGGNT